MTAHFKNFIDGQWRDGAGLCRNINPSDTNDVIGEYAKLSQDTTAAADDVKAFTLASTYSLSKRTTAYAAYVNKNPEGADNNLNIFGLGLRHSF